MREFSPKYLILVRKAVEVMEIIQVNKYLYYKGGAERVVLETGKNLEKTGCKVHFWGMHHPRNPAYSNDDLFVDHIDYNLAAGFKQKIAISLKIWYSFEAKLKFQRLIDRIKPDLVHLHNFAHQISPSILDVIRKAKIPAVMTLHDFKLVCPNYMLFTQDKPCERCKFGRFWNCFLHKCVKDSRAKSLVNSIEMIIHHQLLHIYDVIDCFISPSAFLKNKIQEMGFKRDVYHVPNFINLEEWTPEYDFSDQSVVYFGRLSKEKGLPTLVRAMYKQPFTLQIIGEGPVEEELKRIVIEKRMQNVIFRGKLDGAALCKAVQSSMFSVLASEWYENNPMMVLESFALGKPVLGAAIGGIPELIMDGVTGRRFRSGSIQDLSDKLAEMHRNKEQLRIMGKNARQLIEDQFSTIRHFELLENVYSKAIKKRAGSE